MKYSKETRTKTSEIERVAMPTIKNISVEEIRKEFLPQWFIQGAEYPVCPLCARPHHKEPGPFTYGITVRENEGNISLWVQSFGCCKSQQYFSFSDIKKRKVNKSNLIPILKRIFYYREI
ncbi:MAG: hypothetical protein KKF20_06875 [Bacteroidetes bacterium]|nr:hypothetical protein [Bacteroidota bacterium]MBU1423220.1 hypothetical protein [Bacteroidota bacterium]MBU2472115.1 hypothetical protein [Bacteroidota bacterium]